MTTLLVALQMNDSDDAVLAWARWLHARGGIDKVVLLGLDEPVAMEEELSALVPELLEEAPPVASLLDYLEAERRDWEEASPLVETEVRRGAPWQAAVQSARDLGADLLLVARSLSGDPREGALGVAARRVVRKAPCDVLCVHGDPPSAPAKVLVPTDFSARSDAALRAALALAGADGEVALVHVFRVPRGAATKPADLEKIGARLEEGILQRLAAQAAALGAAGKVVPIARQIPAGIPEVLDDLAGQRGSDLVCIGSRGRTPLAQVALGSVAEGVLEAGPRAVLVHKEKGETMGLLEALGL